MILIDDTSEQRAYDMEYDYDYDNEFKYRPMFSSKSKLNNFNLEKKKLFFDLSLKEIMNKWSIVTIDIINELIEIISLKNYDQYFSNIEDGNQIYVGIYTLIKDIFNTLTKDDRGYYVGISLIIISLIIYYIYITNLKAPIQKIIEK